MSAWRWLVAILPMSRYGFREKNLPELAACAPLLRRRQQTEASRQHESWQRLAGTFDRKPGIDYDRRSGWLVNGFTCLMATVDAVPPPLAEGLALTGDTFGEVGVVLFPDLASVSIGVATVLRGVSLCFAGAKGRTSALREAITSLAQQPDDV